jgi:hypothetical protein
MSGPKMRAALLAITLSLAACLEAPPEGPDPDDPPGTAGKPDAAVVGQRASCDEQFGSAPGYELCAEAESTCSFVSESDADKFDCNERCAEFGATCERGFDANGHTCVAETEDGCAFPHETQICVCLRS